MSAYKITFQRVIGFTFWCDKQKVRDRSTAHNLKTFLLLQELCITQQNVIRLMFNKYV